MLFLLSGSETKSLSITFSILDVDMSEIRLHQISVSHDAALFPQGGRANHPLKYIKYVCTCSCK